MWDNVKGPPTWLVYVIVYCWVYHVSRQASHDRSTKIIPARDPKQSGGAGGITHDTVDDEN